MAYYSVPIKTNIVMLIDRDDYALLRHIGELFPTKKWQAFHLYSWLKQ